MIQPFRRGRDHVRIPADPDTQPLLPRFGHGGKPLHRLLRHHADIDGLRDACPRHRLEARQPKQIVDQMPHALAFLVDPGEGPLIPVLVARLRERQRGLRLDHSQRRPQLVRGVGGEVHLSLAGLFDGRRDPTADGESTQKDDEEEHRPDQQLCLDQVRLRLFDAAQRLCDDRPVIPNMAALDAELGSGHIDGLRIRDACRRNREFHRGGIHTAIAEIAVGMPHPPEDGSVTNVRSSARPRETPGHRLPILGHRRQPLR